MILTAMMVGEVGANPAKLLPSFSAAVNGRTGIFYYLRPRSPPQTVRLALRTRGTVLCRLAKHQAM